MLEWKRAGAHCLQCTLESHQPVVAERLRERKVPRYRLERGGPSPEKEAASVKRSTRRARQPSRKAGMLFERPPSGDHTDALNHSFGRSVLRNSCSFESKGQGVSEPHPLLDLRRCFGIGTQTSRRQAFGRHRRGTRSNHFGGRGEEWQPQKQASAGDWSCGRGGQPSFTARHATLPSTERIRRSTNTLG
jgi:hypothetical protein